MDLFIQCMIITRLWKPLPLEIVRYDLSFVINDRYKFKENRSRHNLKPGAVFNNTSE